MALGYLGYLSFLDRVSGLGFQVLRLGAFGCGGFGFEGRGAVGLGLSGFRVFRVLSVRVF